MAKPKINWENKASHIWPALIKAAKRGELLTYEQLASIIDTNPLSVRHALGPIFNFCEISKLPPLTAIVVRKNSGKPGKGFIKWWGEEFREAFDEVYRFDWSINSNPFGGYDLDDTTNKFANTLLENPQMAEEIYLKVKVRGQIQVIFRQELLIAYGYECAICRCSFESLLQAAHLKPWSIASKFERMDVRNGLLLCANHHLLFDRGLMKINTKLQIQYKYPLQNDSEYSDTDVRLTVAFHMENIKKTKNPLHAPNNSYIEAHDKLHVWKT